MPHSPRRAQKAAKALREEGKEVKFQHEWSNYFSGTLYEMPIEPTNTELIDVADKAIKRAQQTRKLHARKTKRYSPQRKTDIEQALKEITAAMRPLRRKVARIPYARQQEGAEALRAASEGLQRERRKLWKMKSKKNERAPRQKRAEGTKPVEDWSDLDHISETVDRYKKQVKERL